MEKATEDARIRAEAESLGDHMRIAVGATATKGLPSPTIPPPIPTELSPVNRVQDHNRRVIAWDQCELLDTHETDDGAAQTLRCPGCKQGTIVRQSQSGRPTATMLACTHCGVTGDGNYVHW
jgi:hypothetical protein